MKKIFAFGVFVTLCFFAQAQTDFIELGSRQYEILDRFEIMLQRDSILNYSSVKPYDRRSITERLEYIQQQHLLGKLKLSKVDEYNLNMLLKVNFEWRKNSGDTALKIKSFFNKDHLTNPFYYGIKKGDFSLIGQVGINYGFGKENNYASTLFNNSRVLVNFRGSFTKRLGYYAYAATNDQRNAQYVQQFTNVFSAAPNFGYYKSGVNGFVDAFETRGGVMYNAAKGINMQFAFDKFFFGNGHRSLVLSDFSYNYLFLKTNFRFWKFNYTVLFTQMINRRNAAELPITADTLYPRKYMSLHYWDLQLTKWLNIGFFENIVFSRDNGFDLQYANPFIFLMPQGHNTGSPDKTTVGFIGKANINKKTQLYGQLVINELNASEVFKYKNGWWGNKHALQLGFKHINLFKINNLDIQGEVNLVRPFTYTHFTNRSSYTHYNQPLAHPLGANFKEFIGIVRYQPTGKLMLQAKLIYYQQGLDSAGKNMGSNIFLPYTTRPREYGWFTGSGIASSCLFMQATATYELLPNIFIDADLILRRYKQDGTPNFNSNIFSAGIRMNIRKREYDF